MEVVDKVSLTLSQPCRDLRLRFHVVLKSPTREKDKKLINIFEMNDNTYMGIEPNTNVTLECLKKPWDKTKSVLITKRNVHKFERAFTEMVRNIYDVASMFKQTREGKLIIEAETKKKYTIICADYWTNQLLQIVPDVIYDNEDNCYEGVVIYFNHSSNFVELSLDEFEELARAIQKIDFLQYSLQVLTYFNTVRDEVVNELKKETTKQIVQTANIFSPKSQEPVKYKETENSNAKDVFGL